MAEQAENFSEEEINAMSDEEREALGIDDDEGLDNELETDPTEEAEADEEGSDDSDESDDDEPEGQADTDNEPDGDGKPADDAEPAAADAVAEQVAEQKPVASERITEIDAAIEALGDKLEEGDIDFREYNRELAKLNNERQDVVYQVRSEQDAAVKRADNWNTAVNNFMAADEGHKAITSNPIIKQAFETALVQVSQTPEGQKASDEWRLNAAKAELQKAGIALGKAKATEQPKSRQPDTKPPVTLGDMPAAADNQDHSEFSHLNGLDGMDLENALARLTPEQEARYLGQA